MPFRVFTKKPYHIRDKDQRPNKVQSAEGDHITTNFLKTAFHKFCLVWIPCPVSRAPKTWKRFLKNTRLSWEHKTKLIYPWSGMLGLVLWLFLRISFSWLFYRNMLYGINKKYLNINTSLILVVRFWKYY